MRIKTTRMCVFNAVFLIAVACQPAIPGDTIIAELTATPLKEAFEPEGTVAVPHEDVQPSPAATGGLLTLWHPFSGVEAELITDLVQEYNRGMGGNGEVAVFSYADEESLFTEILRGIETGDQPDIILAPSYFLRQLFEESHLKPMDAFIAGEGNENEEVKPFPVFWNIDAVDDVRYGVPYLQNGHFLFYNTSWANALGFSEKPLTVEDFRAQSCAAFDQNRFDEDLENNGTGGYFFPDDSISTASWMQSFSGGPQFNARGEIILETEENIQALSFLLRLFRDDCAWWTNKEQFPYKYFANRNTILFSGELKEIFVQQKTMEENKSVDLWKLIPYPSITTKPIVYFDNYAFGMMQKNDNNSEETAAFIQWMLEPERHLEMVYLTGAFPLSAGEIQIADRAWDSFAIWQDTLQYIPFLQPVPPEKNWYVSQKVLEDLGWQIIQYTVAEADIPMFLKDAEAIANSFINESWPE